MSPEELAGRVARLEANVARIQSDVENLRAVPVETARLAEKVAAIDGHLQRVEGRIDTRFVTVDKKLEELQELISSSENMRRSEEQTRERERKRDRQWLIGAIVASTGIIIAAVGVFTGIG